MSQPDPQPAEIVVEVCTGSLEGARIAESSGADRIELNSALELDGLTPSAGLVQLVSRAVRIPVIAMARPRAGNFNYSESEWETLVSDVRWLLSEGVAGIAFGCLDENQQVDSQRCKEIRDLAGSREVVFHKAFDDVADWRLGIQRLIDSGINRVMTSGQKDKAEDGLDILGELVKLAAGRIEVLPAGGINSKNATKIVNQTGCNQIHGSFTANGRSGIGPEIQRTIDQLAIRSIAH